MRRPFIVLLALLAGACARTRRTPDDTLVVIVDTFVAELDPRYVVTNLETKISRLVSAPLVSVDQQSLEPRLELAERIDPLDPLTLDVTVRADARFADGAPVTARDVVYTFEAVLDPQNHGSTHRMFTERLVSVERVDERRARFHLRQPLATFVTDLDMGILDAREAEVRRPAGFTAGAGPFRVVDMKRGELVLERNPYYFGGAPPMRRVVFRTLEDANARLLVLVGGSGDLTQNTVRLDLLADLADQPRLSIQHGPSALFTYLLLNNDDPILREPRVRQAIACAIDRPRLIAARYGGRARLATGLIAPGNWAYEPDVPRYDYDPARARALLDEAGHPADADGRRFGLVFKTSSDVFRIGVARVIAQELGEVGIAVELRSFEWATVFGDIKKGNYQVTILQTGEIAEPDMYTNFFHSSRIPTKELPDLANRANYRSAEADRLMEAGRHELDRAVRRRIYADLQRLMARDLPVVPLWHEDNVVVANRDVVGYEVLPNARLAGLAKVQKRR